MMESESSLVALDTSVLLNFAALDRLDLLASLGPWSFLVPKAVVAEVRREPAQRRLGEALALGFLREVSDDDEREALPLFAKLRQDMGTGEAACLALAEARGWAIACDEKRLFRREAHARIGPGRLFNTVGLLVTAVRLDQMTLEQADEALAVLASHRFRVKLTSLRDVL